MFGAANALELRFHMSDNWLIVIPVDPLAKPPPDRAQATFDLLCALRPEAQDPELLTYETPEFIYCGSNFSNVFCPLCQADLGNWWDNVFHEWCDSKDQRVLSVETPCCGRSISLNDLDFESPQGFACLAIELMNPDSDLEPEEFRQVESTLGAPMRIIWRHI
jgi:hypothetical protein